MAKVGLEKMSEEVKAWQTTQEGGNVDFGPNLKSLKCLTLEFEFYSIYITRRCREFLKEESSMVRPMPWGERVRRES